MATTQKANLPKPKKAALPKGTGANIKRTRLIVIYSAGGKQGKTGACSAIKGAKWVVSDPNCVHTLDVLDRMPGNDDIYMVSDFGGAQELLVQYLEAGDEAEGDLGIPALVIDSATAYYESLTNQVARQTGQAYIGARREKGADNGWMSVINEWSKFVHNLTELSKMTNVIVICHGKERAEVEGANSTGKSEWHGISLGPKCAERLMNAANIILFCETKTSTYAEGSPVAEDEVVEATAKGTKVLTRRRIYTRPYGRWPAQGGTKLNPHEPADMSKIMKKLGLL